MLRFSRFYCLYVWMNNVRDQDYAYVDKMKADQLLHALSVPCLGHKLRKTNVFGVELVNAN